MLHFETIEAKTLGLLKQLQQTELLREFCLAGGTSLALQIGHKKSIDFDLFGNLQGDNIELSQTLSVFDDVRLLHQTKNIHIFSINGIKVDIVNYPYPWLEQAVISNEISLAHMKDIAAMKLAAVTGRGTRKDFIDICFLLQIFTLDEMLEFYMNKFKDGTVFTVLKSLTYFSDAETDIQPVMLIDLKWEDTKIIVNKQVQDYLNR